MDKQKKMFTLIELQAKSGERVKSFAKKHGFSIQTWYVWRRKYLAAHRPKPENHHEFKEIVLQGSEKSEKTPKIELHLPCGTQVKIY